MTESCSPWRAWEKLGPAVQDEVTELSMRGRRHPDRQVASVAEAWAAAILKADAPSTARVAERLLGLGLRALDAISGVFDGSGSSADEREERDWARRVLAAK